MNSKSDFSDALVDDFLHETANRFFGSRKQLEDMITAFHDIVDEVREKESLVAQRAALLNFVLDRGKAAQGFYAALGLDAAVFANGIDFTNQVLPEKAPFSLNRQNRFIKLVLIFYEALRLECHEYMHGRYYMDPEKNGRENVTSHYQQIKTMSELINENIEKINRDMSPVCVLQYARQFHPEMEAMERITGSGGEFGGATACSIDKKLAYEPIDFETLKLKKFPDMPQTVQVKPVITRYCKTLYARQRDAIHAIMDDICEKIKQHPHRNNLT